MPFKEGDPRPEGAGRKPGTPNRMTSAVKDAIEQAFKEVGGQKYLIRVAEEDPKTFCALLGKVLPRDINIESSQTLSEILDMLKGQKPNG